MIESQRIDLIQTSEADWAPIAAHSSGNISSSSEHTDLIFSTGVKSAPLLISLSNPSFLI